MGGCCAGFHGILQLGVPLRRRCDPLARRIRQGVCVAVGLKGLDAGLTAGQVAGGVLLLQGVQGQKGLGFLLCVRQLLAGCFRLALQFIDGVRGVIQLALQEKAASAILAGGLSVRQTEALAKRLAAEPKTPKPADRGAVDYAAEAQKELSSKLGRGVRIVTGRKKGRIELEYYGIDDLNDLLEALALLRSKKQETP